MKVRMFALCLAAGLSVSLAAAGGDKGKAKGSAEKGKALFEQCAVCHHADSEEKKMGPGLKGLFKQSKLVNGKKPTDSTVRALIEAGGKGMPAFKEMLTEEEKDSVIAYLKTL